MMQFLFPENPLLPVPAAFILNAICAFIAYFILFKVRFFAFLSEKPPVAPFFSVPVAFLSLMVAFIAASVWQNSATAKTAVMNERAALETLYALPLRSPELRGAVDVLLDRYLMLVKTNEWGLRFNASRDENVDLVLKQLIVEAWMMRDPEACDSKSSSNCPTEAVVAEFVSSLEKLDLAREQRLSLGQLQTGEYWGRWELLYVLALMTYVGVGAVHRPNPHTARFAITVTCISVATAFSMITLYIHPYKGPNAMTPSLLDVRNAH